MKVVYENWREMVCAVMLGIGIVCEHIGLIALPCWAWMVYFAVAWSLVGLGVAHEAWEELREGEIFNEFTLMLVASVGAFIIGEYPEAVAVMLFYCVGEKMQDSAASKARASITALMDLRPEKATVVRDGSEETVQPEDVRPGETIRVHCGERVPLDGRLAEGSAFFDASAITGESKPLTISAEGQEVLAGMIPTDRAVEVIVTRAFSESALSRILNMVEEASERKAPAELFIRKFAKIYTPVVCGLALLIAFVPWVVAAIGGVECDMSVWAYRALVFLVISCPCALVISIPLGYFAGIGAASTKGILVKGGNVLDELTRVNAVALDKTGTLTSGKFSVTEVSGDVLGMVAAAETGSSHPIARAIVNYAQERGVELAAVSDIREIAGKGIAAKVGDAPLLVGNARLMEENSIALGEAGERDGLTIYCAVGGRLVGHVAMEDTPKTDAASALEAMSRAGVTRKVVLSGDKQSIVDKLCETLGNGLEGHGDLMPSHKVSHIDALRESGHCVAFAGDGINDAPALVAANIGIAMGAMGSDAAIEAADIVIQDDEPSKIATAIGIGRATRSIVLQNIVFSIGVKVAIMALGALGCVGLWAAVFADVGVALLCVLNAMRLRLMTDRKTESHAHSHRHSHSHGHSCCGHDHHH